MKTRRNMPIPAPSPSVAPKNIKLKTANKITIIARSIPSISAATNLIQKPLKGYGCISCTNNNVQCTYLNILGKQHIFIKCQCTFIVEW